MYIRKIKIDKFKSFYEPFELDFDQVKGLWKVSGSVGSGKTSIGEAILFSLLFILYTVKDVENIKHASIFLIILDSIFIITLLRIQKQGCKKSA